MHDNAEKKLEQLREECMAEEQAGGQIGTNKRRPLNRVEKPLLEKQNIVAKYQQSRWP